MRKHVLAAISAVIAMVLVVVLSFAAMNSGSEAEAYSQTATCSVAGRKDGNTVYVTGSGACQGLSFSFDVNDAAGNGSGQVNIGLPTEVVTEFITKTATATVTARPTGGPSQPSLLPQCSADASTNHVRVVCTLLGKRILNVNLPIKLPTKIPPGQAKQTKTVFVGGPQQFITRYIVEREYIPVTRTVTAKAVSTVVVTETVKTRQTPRPDGKVKPEDKKPDAVDFTDGETTIVEAGIGVLSLLGLMAILLLALYGGYVLGWKDKESKDTDFIGALLDQSKLRR